MKSMSSDRNSVSTCFFHARYTFLPILLLLDLIIILVKFNII